MRVFSLYSLALVMAVGCTSVETVKLKGAKSAKPTTPDKVEIFRSTTPQYNYDETDLVTVRGTDPKVEKVYESLREEAAKQGADAVIKVKITTQQVSVPVTTTSCSGPGHCVTSTSMHTELHYTASGTLVRRRLK